MNDDTRQRDLEKDRTNTEQCRRLVGILDRSETTCPAGVKPLAERLNQNRPTHPSTTTKPQGEVRHGYGTQAEQESSRGITLEDILSSENVQQAWKQVRANKGAAGVDGMEVGDFPDFYAKHWEMIYRKLME